MKQFRQGDVLLIQVPSVPKKGEGKEVPRDPQGRIVLALGEATGHAHALRADADAVLMSFGAERYLKTKAPARLWHEEHDPIDLDGGATFRVIIQSEYDPVKMRQVQD
jgi:hypothetical protein